MSAELQDLVNLASAAGVDLDPALVEQLAQLVLLGAKASDILALLRLQLQQSQRSAGASGSARSSRVTAN